MQLYETGQAKMDRTYTLKFLKNMTSITFRQNENRKAKIMKEGRGEQRQLKF